MKNICSGLDHKGHQVGDEAKHFNLPPTGRKELYEASREQPTSSNG